jgi:rhamnulokinase
VALGTIDGGKLQVKVLHRFPNSGTQLPTGLYWDVVGIWREILHGLKLAGERGLVDSVGVNSWGVDYVLLDEADLLMDGMRHYRDPRTDGAMEDLFKTVPRDHIYDRTGIQFMSLNTIFQVVAHEKQSPGILQRAQALLMVPDLFHFWLCGRKATELTIASTSQLFNPRTRDWDRDLMRDCGIPTHPFCEIVEPGTVLGEVKAEIGLPGAKVIAPAAHDTASAVAAVPAEGTDWAYISSGTWALAGVEVPAPEITQQTLKLNLTHEAGTQGTTRLLKNIVGLWILQECRRAWGDVDYAQLYAEAQGSSVSSIIDTDDARFLQVCDQMPERVRAYCADSGQTIPQTRGDITLCVLKSIAHRSSEVMDQLEAVTAREIRTIHIVGGGSQITLLNQLIADAAKRKVIAGPVDATLIGNLLVQAEACGSIEPGSIRQVVRASEQQTLFEPS